MDGIATPNKLLKVRYAINHRLPIYLREDTGNAVGILCSSVLALWYFLVMSSSQEIRNAELCFHSGDVQDEGGGRGGG